MPSAIGSFDRIATRLQRGATAKFENEQGHKAYVQEKQREALQAQEKFKAAEAFEALKNQATDMLAQEISKLQSTGKLRSKQGFPAVYRQVTWQLPAELKFTEASVTVAVDALKLVLGESSELVLKWENEIKTLTAEMAQRDVERAARKAQQEVEDNEYRELCIVTIQNMFKDQNPDVKNFFKLLPYLREIITVPRHRGLRGQEIIVDAIRFQMSGFAQRWHEQLERSLVRSAEREQVWRKRKAEENAKKRGQHPRFNQVKPEVKVEPVDRDAKWAEEAAAAVDYHQPAYESDVITADEAPATLEDVISLSAEADVEAPVEAPAESVED